MKSEGEKLFKDGLVTEIKGKKIEGIYHIYGTVKNKTKSKEFKAHIKINMQKNKLEGVRCTCEDFEEFGSSRSVFICSHIAASVYKFIAMASKNVKDTASEMQKEEIPSSKSNKTIRVVQKVEQGVNFFEGQIGLGSEKIKLQPNELREFLEKLGNRVIKFKYNNFEFATSILSKDMPITFTIRDREGLFVLTTQKQFPISLNPNNDVYLFNRQLYLPTKNQVDNYIPLYEKLKEEGEILLEKTEENYHMLISQLSSITENIILSEEVRAFAANSLEPEFFIYVEGESIYCDVKVLYGCDKINILKDDNRKIKAIRDYKKEEKILMDAEKCKFIKKDDRLVFIGDDDELFYILSHNRRNLHGLGKVILGKGLLSRRIIRSSAINVELYEEDGEFNFSYNIKEFDVKELNSAFKAYKRNDGFYKTKDNNFIDLEDEGVSSFFSLIDSLNINEKLEDGIVQVEKAKALYLSEQIKRNNIGFIRGKAALEEIEEKLREINRNEIKLPDKFQGKLREYQVQGFKWLKTISSLGFGGILADEMGLGKTIEIIAFLLSEEDRKTIIISPTSLVYNWKSEMEKFAPTLKVGVVHGAKNERNKIFEDIEEYDVVLTTYGTLRMDIEKYQGLSFDYCIIDEGQNIKNSSAQNTKVIKSIEAKVRFALTGTPLENKLTELWSIFDYIMPGYLYSREVFEEKFIFRKDENLENLKLMIKPFILRRVKAEVMRELPGKIEKKLLVEMTPAQKAVYKKYINKVRMAIKNNTDGRIEVFSYLTKLRQICLDPSIILEGYLGGSGKQEVAMELIEGHIEAEGKVLLFSQFTTVLSKIGESLNERGIKYYVLDGTTRPKERLRLVNDFNNCEDVKAFLISLKAGGTGLNLTSANLVIHFDPWWNPAVEDQATDRAHRIGQKNIVEVIKLVAKGTIEEKIVMLQQHKKDLIDSIITGELKNSNILNGLSKEELVQLFSKD